MGVSWLLCDRLRSVHCGWQGGSRRTIGLSPPHGEERGRRPRVSHHGAATVLAAILRDAALRAAPQDEDEARWEGEKPGRRAGWRVIGSRSIPEGHFPTSSISTRRAARSRSRKLRRRRTIPRARSSKGWRDCWPGAWRRKTSDSSV